VADRYFATEKFLAFSHLVGGISLLLLPLQKTFWPFWSLMLLHCLFYVPTLSLTNSISFANLKDARKDFGGVRLWANPGWIAASWLFVFMLQGKTGTAFDVSLARIFTFAGWVSLVLAAFCLTLPHTPPQKTSQFRYAPLESLKLLAKPCMLVLFVVAFLDALVLYTYFFWTGPFLGQIGIPENWKMAVMSLGQIAEIGAMAVLGVALKKLGWRKTMMLGIAGQVVRYAIYALGSRDLAWLVVASNLVHGVCYAFFFATLYIFVDEHFPKDARASAQGLFNLLILGIGQFVSNYLSGWLGDVFKRGDQIRFDQLFLVPLGLSVLALLILAISFHPPEKPRTTEPVLAVSAKETACTS
jgi:nucleoside transporter